MEWCDLPPGHAIRQAFVDRALSRSGDRQVDVAARRTSAQNCNTLP